LSKHIVMYGDISSAYNYHVGDEAMFEAALSNLRHLAPETSFTALSADPTYSAQFYGIDAIQMPDLHVLGKTREQIQQIHVKTIEFARVVDRGEPLPDDFVFADIIHLLQRADGVVITGGGNMRSSWLNHLYLRLTLLRVAQIFGKRCVVLGQTFGPDLNPQDSLYFLDALNHVEFIGTRETHSTKLLRSLGIHSEKLHYHIDNASIMQPEPVDGFDDGNPLIGLSFQHRVISKRSLPLLQKLADQLVQFSAETDAHYVYIPQSRSGEATSKTSDPVLGERLAEAIGDRAKITVLDIPTARQNVYLTQRMSMVISARYHPIVFAAGAAVPAIAIYSDDYLRIKQQGALRHAHLQKWALPLAALQQGLLDAMRELWQKRDAIRKHLFSLRHTWIATEREYWSAVCRALGIEPQHVDTLHPYYDYPAQPETTPAAQINPQGAWYQQTRMIKTKEAFERELKRIAKALLQRG
jgi:polysaccharide pyruvyl transferase WcaK-like protein